jgi:hypothetical protein
MALLRRPSDRVRYQLVRLADETRPLSTDLGVAEHFEDRVAMGTALPGFDCFWRFSQRPATPSACDSGDALQRFCRFSPSQGWAFSGCGTCAGWSDIVSRSCRAIWLPRHSYSPKSPKEARPLLRLRLNSISYFSAAAWVLYAPKGAHHD